ncbi:MAG TPA: response regulator [Pyrinomonadaceae bacterium]|jgi:PleD family two-component response regulator|nr:response regulator [Pyrinomonadaceae bacterium]
MAKRILWLDNDPAYLEPFIETLTDEGYEVDVVATVAEAEQCLADNKYDLLLLDVMIPTTNAQEEERYDPNLTKLGYKTGFLFYVLNKALFLRSGIRVLIMTVRLDRAIMDEFVNAGLERTHFATKYDLRDANVFLAKIQSILGEPKRTENVA